MAGKILVTGATGNVGLEVIRRLVASGLAGSTVAGVRNSQKDALRFADLPISVRTFDFEKSSTFEQALDGCDTLFLLRPPQLARLKPFQQLIGLAIRLKIRHIIFLSVQGADHNAFIPHHKIEQAIKKSNLPYTFLRPAYFMQNFNTTLRSDIKAKVIFLPAGKAKFTLVDVRDIGEVVAEVARNPSGHINKAYDLTATRTLSFPEMIKIINSGKHLDIRYESPNPVRFYFRKKKEGLPAALILVMIMLHYLPRFRKQPSVSDCIHAITESEPFEFEDFVRDELRI